MRGAGGTDLHARGDQGLSPLLMAAQNAVQGGQSLVLLRHLGISLLRRGGAARRRPRAREGLPAADGHAVHRRARRLRRRSQHLRQQRRPLLVSARAAACRGRAARSDAGRPQRRLRTELHRLALRGAHRCAAADRRHRPRARRRLHDDADDELTWLAWRLCDRRRSSR